MLDMVKKFGLNCPSNLGQLRSLMVSLILNISNRHMNYCEVHVLFTLKSNRLRKRHFLQSKFTDEVGLYFDVLDYPATA